MLFSLNMEKVKFYMVGFVFGFVVVLFIVFNVGWVLISSVCVEVVRVVWVEIFVGICFVMVGCIVMVVSIDLVIVKGYENCVKWDEFVVVVMVDI